MIKTFPLHLGQALRSLNSFLPQSSWRIVNNPAQSQIICAVIDHTQIRKHVLYFRTVKEAHTANYTIRNAISFERKFNCVRLGIGAVQYRKILKPFSFGPGDDLAGNIVSFCTLVSRFKNRNWIPFCIGSPKPLPLPSNIIGNHCVCRIQNCLGGTVVLFQSDDTGSSVLLFKTQNILDRRTAKAVNTLIVITNNTDILIAACQKCR